MKTCGALLVLLCCCLAETQLRGESISENDITHQGHYGEAESRENEVMGAVQRSEPADTASTQQTCQPDIHTVLREMSNQVAKLEVELRYTKRQMGALETRLRASEKTVEEQRAELRQTEARLTDRLRETKSENEAQAVDLNLTVSHVEELRRERDKSRVSFSASLLASGSVNKGPISEAIPLVYTNLFNNIGNAYNPNTGVFTAPVRGVYYFVLHVLGSASPTAVSLHKNKEKVLLAYGSQGVGRDNPSNGASLLLEVGDVVYVKLWPGASLYDNENHHTTFSGHLLFLM